MGNPKDGCVRPPVEGHASREGAEPGPETWAGFSCEVTLVLIHSET